MASAARHELTQKTTAQSRSPSQNHFFINMKIIPPLKLPKQEQHDRVFLQDAIERYKNKLLTAAGYIYTIIKIYRQAGHRLNIPHPRSFYEYFQIPKSTFYRALIQLERAQGIRFRWEPVGGIAMWWEDEHAAAVDPHAAAVDPHAAAVDPHAAAVDPHAAAVDPHATAVDPHRWNQIPTDMRGDFEAFVRSQWKKIRGQEIHSFHRFVDRSKEDFRDWWEKFKARPMTNTQSPTTQPAPATVSKFSDDSERVSPEQIRQLRQLLASKK